MMNGLYNMLFGTNPASQYLLAAIGFNLENQSGWPLSRFRDTYANEDGTKVFVFTRNGGLPFEDQVMINEKLTQHPNYVKHWLDEFDSTYCTYEFNVPEEFLKITKQIAEMTDTMPPMQRFKKLMDDMTNNKSNEQVDHAVNAGNKILDAILSATDQTVEHGDGSVEVVHFSHKP